MLLSIGTSVLLFQWWKILRLDNQLKIANDAIARDEFSIGSKIIEQERGRISAELHDELGTLLSVICLDLELVTHEASALTPYAESRLSDIKRNLNLVIESIRTNIWNLSGQMFDQADLGFVVRELCHKIDRYKGTQVTFVQSGMPFQLPEKYKLNLFRITQELLTNLIKHSTAWNISVHLDWDGKQNLCIIVEDDGLSYSDNKVANGLGTINITRRANYINAHVTRQKLKKGNRIILSVDIV